MSYDIDLIDPITKKVIQIEDAHFIRGGTYKLGGSTKLSLNVTFNYNGILANVLKPDETPSSSDTGLRSLDGMIALTAIPILKDAISHLKDDYSDNYWEATEGNVKLALNNLLTLCQMRPDAIIKVYA